MWDCLTSSYMKCVLLLTAGMSLILLTVFILYSIVVHADSSAAEQKTECFTSIQVHPGESLWEISMRYYSKEYQSMNQYIRRIMKLNHLTDEKINAGAYLIIPYYHVEDLGCYSKLLNEYKL